MELQLSKIMNYKSEIIFTISIIIIAFLLKGIFNFILDYRVIIIVILIAWYFGYLNTIKDGFYNNMISIKKIIKK